MDEANRNNQQPQQQPDPPAPTGQKRVLVLEDEHFISELYQRALQKAGFDATFITDGPSGLAAALTDKFDIILLDIMIPNMTGIEVLREIRAKAPALRAKVIITTNLEQSEEDRKVIENQADGYLIKAEVTPRQLVEFLQRIK